MLAILTTHPIQYQVPMWQALARDTSVPFEVWYLSEHADPCGDDADQTASIGRPASLAIRPSLKVRSVQRSSPAGESSSGYIGQTNGLVLRTAEA